MISEFCGDQSTPHLHEDDIIQEHACDAGFIQMNKSGMVNNSS